MKIQNALGQVLSKERQRIGLSQMELSERAALHLNTIQGLESGRFNLKLTTVFQIAKALQMPVSTIMESVEAMDLEIPTDKY
jgi:transcriptional regulator with XRE-family HTH domain